LVGPCSQAILRQLLDATQRPPCDGLHELWTDDPARNQFADNRPVQAELMLDGDVDTVLALAEAPGDMHAASHAAGVLELDDAVGQTRPLDRLPTYRDQA